MKKIKIIAYTCLIIPILFSCCFGNKTSRNEKAIKKAASATLHFDVTPLDGVSLIAFGNEVGIQVKPRDTVHADSIKILLDATVVNYNHNDSNLYTFSAMPDNVGTNTYKIRVFYGDSLSQDYSVQLFILPDKEPKQLSYSVIRKFWHDPKAYTQGLIYHDGFIYESTGRKGMSSLRKISVDNGEIINKLELENTFFGEGITLINNEVFMITYTSQVGFVYDLSTFEEIRKFNLQTRQGWGLTNNGKELILSDGSATLYFYEPAYFSLLRQKEICDNKGLKSYLNELEFTPMGLFANVYGKPHILLIDTDNGAVKGILDLSRLFPKEVPKSLDFVLNGIAYNAKSNSFYVTGKQWPVMYEIRINTD